MARTVEGEIIRGGYTNQIRSAYSNMASPQYMKVAQGLNIGGKSPANPNDIIRKADVARHLKKKSTAAKKTHGSRGSQFIGAGVVGASLMADGAAGVAIAGAGGAVWAHGSHASGGLMDRAGTWAADLISGKESRAAFKKAHRAAYKAGGKLGTKATSLAAREAGEGAAKVVSSKAAGKWGAGAALAIGVIGGIATRAFGRSMIGANNGINSFSGMGQ